MTDIASPEPEAGIPAPAALQQLDTHFKERPAEELVRWSLETFGDELALGTAFGPSGIVLLHMVSRLQPQATLFYIDTGNLFDSTYALRDELEARLGIRFIRLQPELSLEEQAARYGPRLWARDPDLCCHLRKVLPLHRFLAGKRAWMTGLRREQSPSRADIRLVAWDSANQVVKINPLASWREAAIWEYIQTHRLPTNLLHEKGYPSLGCVPCTRPVAPNQGPRAGRWPGFEKLECGIHRGGGRVRRTGAAGE